MTEAPLAEVVPVDAGLELGLDDEPFGMVAARDRAAAWLESARRFADVGGVEAGPLS